MFLRSIKLYEIIVSQFIPMMHLLCMHKAWPGHAADSSTNCTNILLLLNTGYIINNFMESFVLILVKVIL
jgi:hypothetical protein